jgi:pyruvate-ferredoxin/flavodoxin oxidoreductase
MAELADEWSSERTNVRGSVPPSSRRARSAADLHGALQSGALATTFTALRVLLMIPNI